MAHKSASPPVSSSEPTTNSSTVLTWRVHLLRREPYRLPTLLLLLFIAAVCVWLMFRSGLPVLIALLLLVSAASEYLFPVTYRLTTDGAFAAGATNRLAVAWKEARRIFPERNGLVVTPLERPSRLDSFRGVLLRFAPDGEPGDRASVCAAIAQVAPTLLTTSEPLRAAEMPNVSESKPTPAGGHG